MNFRRLSMTLGITSLLISGIYACSSDDDTNTASGNDAGVDTGTVKADTGTVETPDTGTVETPDTGTTEDDAGDASTGTTADCAGNPLVADGGSPDASFTIASMATSVGSGSFLYGPVWTDLLGGNLVYSQTFQDRLSRTDGDGGAPFDYPTTTDRDEQPLQNAINNGVIYTALSKKDAGGTTFMTTPVDAGTATISTFMTLPAVDGGLIYASGVAVHAKGILFFTDPQFQNPTVPTAGIYSMPVAGGAITTLATYTADLDDRPVGIAFNKDQSALFVSHYAQIVTGPGGHITKHPVDANGAVGASSTLPFQPAGRPLGIAVDSIGNIWIAEESLDGNSGLVEVIDATGVTKWGTITIPNARATGVAFGGPDRKRVFITTEQDTTTATLYKTASRCAGF